MTLNGLSSFYYGIHIDEDNLYLNFDEGAGELATTISVSSYSLTDFLVAIKTALDAAGTETYTVTLDRDTRQITIATTGTTLSLLMGTGAQRGISAWKLMGFTGAVDLTGLTSYTGDSGAGFEYTNQFVLQDYVDPDHWQEKVQPSVNESAGGIVETVSFGTRRLLEFNNKYITNVSQGPCSPIANNQTGVEEMVAFYQDIVNKGPFEFIPSSANRSFFYKVLLESTPTERSGTGYKLRHMTSQNLFGYYETGTIKLRVME